MIIKRQVLGLVAWSLACGSALGQVGQAHAHFKLLAPASWLNEGTDGAPQKGGPCGPGGYDNVNPTPTSMKVTEFHAGDTIDVQWVDTVAHPGYFRIALAPDRTQLVNPTITQDGSCNFDETMVPKTAQGNVLADGISFRSRVGFSDAAGKMFSQKVTLPNTPCDKCTLQVMQIMENDLQSLSKCYYFHCADIKILPAAGGAGTSGGSAGSAGSAGTGGNVTADGGLAGVSGGAGAGSAGAAAAGSSGAVGVAGANGGAAGIGGAGTGGGAGVTGAAGMGTSLGNDTAHVGTSKSSCAVRRPGERSHEAGSALFALAALALLRRRHCRTS